MVFDRRAGGENLPLTPLHYPIVYILYRLNRRFSLPGLAVGSMFPNLEIPILILLFGTRLPTKLVLHSLLGAATVGTILSAALTVSIYPPLMSCLFGIEKERIKRRTKPSFTLLFSCLIGNISHVLLDVVNHTYNPIF